MIDPEQLDSLKGEFEVLHFIPGRVRIRLHRLKGSPALAEEVRGRLSAIEGVRSVETNHVTGTVLLQYDPAGIQWESVLSVARELQSR